MNLTSIKTIKDLFKKSQSQPLKQLGQNFFVDKEAIQKIIDTARFQASDVILEIGPGIGAITKEIAKKARKVIAVEKDPKMREILKETLKDFKNVKIVKGDILEFEPKTYNLEPKIYKVVANLPFYLTTPVIRKFLETEYPPKEMILVVQKEVAQRICACPPKMSILAVSVQVYAKPEIISYISKKSFWPQPKVNSAILKITPLINADRKLINADIFFRIVKTGFVHPRKQILNNLALLKAGRAPSFCANAKRRGSCLKYSQGLKLNKIDVEKWLIENNIRPNQRAETLSVQDWLNLTKTYNRF